MWASFLYNDESAVGDKSGVATAAAGARPASMSLVEKPHLESQRSGHVHSHTFAPGYFRSETAADRHEAIPSGDEDREEVSPAESGTIARIERTGPPAVCAEPNTAKGDKRPSSSFFQTAPPRLDPTSNAWASNTAPPSAATGKAGGSSSGTGGSAGSGNGIERYGYLSFSEVQLDDEDQDDDRIEVGSWGSYASINAGTMRNSARLSQDALQRRLKKRARAWRRFLAVMQDHGLRVRKHHRRGKGWANRVVKYDAELPGLRWKSSKWWDSGGGQLPLRDVLDVERSGKIVWVKCLHLGTVGFEASLETDSVIFYLAIDSLLNKRCGVDERLACLSGPILS